ncbi:MAG TPA: hypothetical protein VFF91_11190 [Pseudoxanthomonas sp.]|mgnify:FL=1|nr:hypothetical protein [Pseudoxanthomonas sp.]
MSAPLPPLPDEDAQAREHLRVLSVLHYVLAALTGLMSLLPVFHLLLGLGLATGHLASEDPDATVVGWFFVGFAGLFIVGGLTLAGFIAWAGHCLARQRRHRLCLVVAAVECLLMPLGTVLGVFALIALTKPRVRALFA